MLEAISLLAFKSASVSPRTMAPETCSGPCTRAWASTTGSTWVTPGMARRRAISAARPGPLMAGPVTKASPLKPSIRPTSSVRKPFITLITMISVATASRMPTKEMIETSATPPSRRLARR